MKKPSNPVCTGHIGWASHADGSWEDMCRRVVFTLCTHSIAMRTYMRNEQVDQRRSVITIFGRSTMATTQRTLFQGSWHAICGHGVSNTGRLLHLRAFQFQSHHDHSAPVLCSHCNAHASWSIAIQHMPQVGANKNRGVTAWVTRVWVQYPELVSAHKPWNRTCGSRFSTATRPHTGTSSFS